MNMGVMSGKTLVQHVRLCMIFPAASYKFDTFSLLLKTHRELVVEREINGFASHSKSLILRLKEFSLVGKGEGRKKFLR